MALFPVPFGANSGRAREIRGRVRAEGEQQAAHEEAERIRNWSTIRNPSEQRLSTALAVYLDASALTSYAVRSVSLARSR